MPQSNHVYFFFQELFERSLNILYRLIQEPYVLPGNGCIEALMVNSLQKVNGICHLHDFFVPCIILQLSENKG